MGVDREGHMKVVCFRCHEVMEHPAMAEEEEGLERHFVECASDVAGWVDDEAEDGREGKVEDVIREDELWLEG